MRRYKKKGTTIINKEQAAFSDILVLFKVSFKLKYIHSIFSIRTDVLNKVPLILLLYKKLLLLGQFYAFFYTEE